MEGLPSTDYFNLCAKYLIEFEDKLKNKNYKNKSLKELINDDKKMLDNKKNKNDMTKNILEENLHKKPVYFFIWIFYYLF